MQMLVPMPKPDFKEIQLQLAAHFRDPENNPAPAGLERKRLNVYCSLFFNNIVGFISNGFPVLRKFYTKSKWEELIRKFYSQHKSHSPYFAEISKEFVHFLDEEYQPTDGDPPFIAELAHYEWAELALAVADADIDWHSIERSNDFLNRPPILSPLAWRFVYRWKVHQISPDYIPQKPSNKSICLILCRNKQDKIHFILINEVTYCLLEQIEKNTIATGQQHIQATIRQLGLPNTQAVMDGALKTLNELFAKEVILGVRKDEN